MSKKKTAVKGGMYDVSSGMPPPQDIDGGSVKPAPKASQPKKSAPPKMPASLNKDEAFEREMGEGTPQLGLKAGGMTASKRADGIAQRGKTRGRMV
jgi:hypothetical protein